MRSIILGCRSILVGAVVAGLVTFPAMAASEQPLATVVSAQSAYLAKANAVPGADVYLDDDLVTDPGGSLRLKVGQGQVYLLSSSEATLRQQENKVRAKMYRARSASPRPRPINSKSRRRWASCGAPMASACMGRSRS